MMSSTKIQFAAAAVLGFSALAYAAGALYLWTAEDGYVYVDEGYLGAGAFIEPVTIPGSQAEQDEYTEFRVTLPAGAGSLTEDTRYVGLIPKKSETPVSVQLTEADQDWLPTSGNVGALRIEDGNKDAIRGKLFGYNVKADAVNLNE